MLGYRGQTKGEMRVHVFELQGDRGRMFASVSVSVS